MVALDARHVDHARRTAQQHAAREGQFGQRLVAAFGDRAGAIGDALAALQQLGHHRVVLEALELHVGIEIRVLVVQVDHKAHHHQVVLVVIDERAAAGVLAQGPAHRVDHPALLELLGADLPDLLHAQAVFLRLVAVGQVQAVDDLFRQRPAHALADEDILAVQFHAGLVMRAGGAVGLQPHLARDHATHAIGAIFVPGPDDLAGRHAGEDLDAQLLGLLGQPAAHAAHRDDEVAVVVHQPRHRPVGHPHLAPLAQHIEVVVGDGGPDRGALLAPVGDQPVQPHRVQHRPRQDMGADLGPLLQDHHRQVRIDLLEPDRCGQARRPRPNDHDVILHRLAGGMIGVGHGCSSFPFRTS